MAGYYKLPGGEPPPKPKPKSKKVTLFVMLFYVVMVEAIGGGDI